MVVVAPGEKKIQKIKYENTKYKIKKYKI